MGDYAAQKEVARANRAFYAAFEKLDPRAMAAVWSDAPEDDVRVHCVHPGWEMLTGRARVLRSWEMIFHNTRSITFDVSDVAIDVRGELALVTGVENIQTEAGGQSFGSTAVTLNVFVRRGGAWRLLVHHASPVLHRGSAEAIEADPEGGGG